MKALRWVPLLMVLAGCATGTHLVTGTQRDPIDPDQVTIYPQPPTQKYEVIGIVNARASGNRQIHMDAAVAKIKEQAAMLGANGIIIGGANFGATSAGVGVSSGGSTLFGVAEEPIQLSGQAIYVTPHFIFDDDRPKSH